jgi:rhodanese-related sulfurtransferase
LAGIAARGLAAAVFGSVAFYLVMETLWGQQKDTGRNWFSHFFAWAFAWTPGLLALTAGSRNDPGSRRGTPATGAITAAELNARIERGDPPRILDVRSRGEFAAGHIPGAVNIPFTQALSGMGEVLGSASDETVVYCGHGPRAYLAGMALQRGGRRHIVYLTGHWAAWRVARLRSES